MVKVYKNTVDKALLYDIDAFIENTSPGSIFHSSLMFEWYFRTKNCDPVYFVSYAEGKIVGVLLAIVIQSYSIGLFGRRALVLQEPVVCRKGKTVMLSLLDKLDEHLGKKVFYSEIRQVRNDSDLALACQSLGYIFQERSNLIVDLRCENVFDNLSDSKKRQIKKSMAEGVSFGSAQSIDDVNAFYEILSHLYAKKVKKPLPDYSFFETAYHLSSENQSVQVLVVKYKARVIGGMLMFGKTRQTSYEWYVAGLHDEYKRLYPSVIATWAGIDRARILGAKKFDFMGGGVPHQPYGVRDFKARFGSEQETSLRLYTSRYSFLLRIAKRIIKMLNY